MSEEIGIVMSLYDKVSPTLKSIGNNTKAFDKDLQELEQACKSYEKSQESLVKDISTLKSKLTESNVKVKEAKKAWEANKDVMTKGMMDKAIEEQETYKAKLKDTEAALNHQRKAVTGLADEVRKAGNSPTGGGGEASGLTGLMSGLKEAGVFKLFSDSASGAVGAVLESAIGVPTARLASGIVSGAMTGAAMGSVIPGLGTAVGAVLGGASGAISGVTEIFQAQDDAFKSYVQEAAQGQIAQRDSDIQSGSSIAAGREKDLISFSTLFKDRGTAEDYLGDLVDMANSTPFLYDDLTAMSKTLATYGYGADSILPVLRQIGDTGAALGMSTSDMNMVATALGRMKSSNKTSLEYLNILNDRGIGAVGMLAEEYGVDQGTMYDMISKGEVEGGKAAEIILAALTDSFAGAMSEQSKTFSGLSSTLEGMNQELQNAYGAGYNEERGRGVKDQIEWLSGASGEVQEEANKAVGAWQASLENAKERYVREAVDAAMASDEYQQAKSAGDAAEMGRVIMQAKVRGMDEYNANEGMDEALASEKALVQGIRKDAALREEYWNAGLVMGQEYTKGLAATATERRAALGYKTGPELAQDERQAEYDAGLDADYEYYMSLKGKGAAYGLNRVPYDNFPALLHQGERVLTASQARQADVGGGVSVTFSGPVTVREEADLDRLARKLAAEVLRAKTLAAP